MQVQRVQNNSSKTQFQGILQIQNFRKGGKVTERITADVFDSGLCEKARQNLFNGDWSNEGRRNIERVKLSDYTSIIKRNLGITLPESADKVVSAEFKNLGDGYSVQVGNDYKITHVF